MGEGNPSERDDWRRLSGSPERSLNWFAWFVSVVAGVRSWGRCTCLGDRGLRGGATSGGRWPAATDGDPRQRGADLDRPRRPVRTGPAHRCRSLRYAAAYHPPGGRPGVARRVPAGPPGRVSQDGHRAFTRRRTVGRSDPGSIPLVGCGRRTSRPAGPPAPGWHPDRRSGRSHRIGRPAWPGRSEHSPLAAARTPDTGWTPRSQAGWGVGVVDAQALAVDGDVVVPPVENGETLGSVILLAP